MPSLRYATIYLTLAISVDLAFAETLALDDLPKTYCVGEEEGISDQPVFRARKSGAPMYGRCVLEFRDNTKTYHSEAVVSVNGRITPLSRVKYDIDKRRLARNHQSLGTNYRLVFVSQDQTAKLVLDTRVTASDCRAEKNGDGCDTDACGCSETFTGTLALEKGAERLVLPVAFHRGSEHGVASEP